MASPNAMIPAPALPILRFRVSSERKEPSVGGLGTVRGRCARATFGRRQSRGRGQRAAQVGRCLLPQDPTSFEMPSVMSVMEHALFPLFPPALRGPFRLMIALQELFCMEISTHILTKICSFESGVLSQRSCCFKGGSLSEPQSLEPGGPGRVKPRVRTRRSRSRSHSRTRKELPEELFEALIQRTS